MRRNLLAFAGLLAILLGVLWTLQGLGLLKWPPESFMIADRTWAIRGAVLAVVGAILVAGVRMVPEKKRKDED